jgi:VanZ family protein
VVRAVAGGLPRRFAARTAAVAIAITATYAATDEIHQMFVPGRSAEVADLIFDTLGACVGTSACWAWGVIRHKAQVTSHKSETHRL